MNDQEVMEWTTTHLNKYRAQIDEVDRMIVNLIQRRLRLSLDIKEVEKIGKISVEDLKREHQVFENLEKYNTPEHNRGGHCVRPIIHIPTLKKIFEFIITESKKLQHYKQEE